MTTESVHVLHVGQLAKRLGMHIAIYDLETTTFRGNPQFGITEVHCFFISPSGQCAEVGGLVNPQRTISAKASEITGITQDMVKNSETWDKRFATMFLNMAKGECWVGGFNNATFDNPAVVEVNARYGKPIEAFQYTFDVRKLHLALSQAKGSSGTLVEVGQFYGVFPRGNLHRAQADVALTVDILDAIIARYGVAAVAAHIEANPGVASTLLRNKAAPVSAASGTPAPGTTEVPPTGKRPSKSKQTTQALVDYVKDKSEVSFDMLCDALSVDARTLSFEIGKVIDERLVSAQLFADAKAQQWLVPALTQLAPEVLAQGKLKPIYEALAPNESAAGLDYIQLRVALLAQGHTWSTLRAH